MKYFQARDLFTFELSRQEVVPPATGTLTLAAYTTSYE